MEQELPDASFKPLGATDFSSLRNFRKTAFPASLTVDLGEILEVVSKHVVIHFDRWRFELDA